jgi:hypothetical protein
MAARIDLTEVYLLGNVVDVTPSTKSMKQQYVDALLSRAMSTGGTGTGERIAVSDDHTDRRVPKGRQLDTSSRIIRFAIDSAKMIGTPDTPKEWERRVSDTCGPRTCPRNPQTEAYFRKPNDIPPSEADHPFVGKPIVRTMRGTWEVVQTDSQRYDVIPLTGGKSVFTSEVYSVCVKHAESLTEARIRAMFAE